MAEKNELVEKTESDILPLKPTAAENIIWKPFKHPAFNVICGIITILSFIFAFYFYNAAKIYPQLVVFVHPVKATIVKSGQASDIKTFYRDKEINTDVTVTQVAIWNQGNASIKKEHVLKPIVLFTDNNAPILEATIRKSTREDVTKLNLNEEDIQNGRLTISWNILEQDDGAVIQIIYAGDSQTNVKFEGVIEGQKEIDTSTPTLQIKSPEEQYLATKNGYRFWTYAAEFVPYLILTLAIIIILISAKTEWRSYSGVFRYFLFCLNLIFIIGLLIVAFNRVYDSIHSKNLVPPFDLN